MCCAFFRGGEFISSAFLCLWFLEMEMEKKKHNEMEHLFLSFMVLCC